MNECPDRSVRFEIQQMSGWKSGWFAVSNHSTREEAEEIKAELDPSDKMNLRVYRIFS